MQEFVEAFIKEREAALAAEAEAAATAKKREREARLIRLGMCTVEYAPDSQYSEEYPYQEYKTGKFYRLVPHTVSDEEYAAICRYDDTPVAVKPSSVTARLFGRTARRIRRLTLLRLLLGVVASLLGAAVLYLIDSEMILFSLAVFLLGTVFSFAGALSYYAIGETLSAVEYLVANQQKTATSNQSDEKE